MEKKKSSSAARKPVISAPCGGETTMFDQPAKKNAHAEEVDVADNPSPTPSTSVDNETAADARRESNLDPNESTISYAETRPSLESEPFR
jgi:hypothetical protein